MLLAALVGGFTRQLWVESERRQQETLDQVTRMSIANDLLHALHDVVQTLPSSLDLSDVLTSAQETFRQLVDSTVAVVLVPDDTSDVWHVELAEGVRLPDTLLPEELSRTLVRALDDPDVVLVDDLEPGTGGACGAETRSVLATALRAQDRVVGLVSIEHRDASAYTDEDARLISGLASSLALAVDNARWFSRLRTLGAEAERARIARDLHDRVAQSLAYIGFELDRLATVHDDPELRDLQGVVRGVVGELRETLFQLRANVSESQDLVDVARDYITRWSDRTGVEAEFLPHTGGRRVPVQVEQELWRILQESLTNVERHADASHAWVSWRIGDGRAQLEVRDDGRGMSSDGAAPRALWARRHPRARGRRRRPRHPDERTDERNDRARGDGGSPMTRVMIADDHQLLRQALRRALEEAGLEVVAEAGDGEEATRLVSLHRPDVVVMDVTMPVLDGIEATRRIHAATGHSRVLVLTMHDEDALRVRALRAGAVGFLTKDCAMHEVVDTVRQVAAGETVFSPDIAAAMMSEFPASGDGLMSAHTGVAVAVESPLTKREHEILQLVADGHSTTEIAHTLFISAKTVKNHLASIYAKLDSRDRTQAVLSGMRMGIVQLQ